MTTYIEFECGDGEILAPGQSAQDAYDSHDAICRHCPDLRTEYEKRLDAEAQKAWEARIDAALATTRNH